MADFQLFRVLYVSTSPRCLRSFTTPPISERSPEALPHLPSVRGAPQREHEKRHGQVCSPGAGQEPRQREPCQVSGQRIPWGQSFMAYRTHVPDAGCRGTVAPSPTSVPGALSLGNNLPPRGPGRGRACQVHPQGRAFHPKTQQTLVRKRQKGERIWAVSTEAQTAGPGGDGRRQSVGEPCSGARRRAGKLSHLQGWGEQDGRSSQTSTKLLGTRAQGRRERTLQKGPPSVHRAQRSRSPRRP